MIKHTSITITQWKSLIRSGAVKYAGNQRLKIYGTLHCTSGKRMKRENRVFFTAEAEALKAGYRPCGHCMRAKRSSL
jgi:methylphosphotriester-DNA--protein-cysteine methyltransferase